MRKFVPFSFLFLCGFFAACLPEDKSLSVLKTECWTNLMPGSEVKTYLHIFIQNSGDKKFSIEGLTILKGDQKFEIKKAAVILQDMDSSKTKIMTEFTLPGEETGFISAELSYKINGTPGNQVIDSIKVEKVY